MYPLLGLGLLSQVLGAEHAMVFSATSSSTVVFGNIKQELAGCNQCRACQVTSDLCYPEQNPFLYTVNFTNLVMPQSAITLETWVRFDELNSTTNLISASDGMDEFRNPTYGAGGFRLGFFRDFPAFGVAVGDTSDGLPDQDLMSVSGPPSPNWIIGRWYHLAGTWDGVHRKLYVDGELMDAYRTPYPAYSLIRYSTAQFALGASMHCNIQVMFSGALAEVRMWNVARTGAQIAALMNVRANGTELGLRGLWREVVGGSVQDVSGHQPPGNATAVTNVVIPFPPSLSQSNDSWTVRYPCKVYTGSFCKDFVDYPYYAPNNTWMWRTEATISNLGLLKSLASNACYNTLVAHVCGLWYPRCLRRNVTQVHQPDASIVYPEPLKFETWVPMPVASDKCSSIVTACKVELATIFANSLTDAFTSAAYQQGTPDGRFNNSQCLGTWFTEVYNTSRGRVFPAPDASTSTYGSFEFDDPFVASSAVLSPELPSCDYPFVLRSSYSEEMQIAFIAKFLNLSDLPVEVFSESPYCQTQCPPAIMKPEQYDVYARVTGGIAIFSFLFSFAILVLILRDPHKRRFPGNLTALILGSVSGLSLALSFSVFGSWDQYFCFDMHNTQASQGDSGLCDTQAIFVQFFLSTTQGYWCSMCAFLHTVLRLKPSTNWMPYVLLPLVFALVSVIILAAAGKIGLASSANICWVKSGESGYSWLLYYAPGLLNVLFSCYIVGFYVFNRKGGFKTDAAFLRMMQITMLLFIAAIFSIAAASNISAQYPSFIYNSAALMRCRTLALAYTLYRDLHDPSLRNVQKNLDAARAVGGFDITGNPDSCPSYDPGFNVGVFYVDQVVLAILGTAIPIMLLAKHAKKICGIQRWTSVRMQTSVDLKSTGGSTGGSSTFSATRSSNE